MIYNGHKIHEVLTPEDVKRYIKRGFSVTVTIRFLIFYSKGERVYFINNPKNIQTYFDN